MYSCIRSPVNSSVDDESPDCTARLVREFARGECRVQLLEGRRRGLGDACVRGITHALETLGADVIVQMNADFSHDPADARWSVGRRLLSRWGNRLARTATGAAGNSSRAPRPHSTNRIPRSGGG